MIENINIEDKINDLVSFLSWSSCSTIFYIRSETTLSIFSASMFWSSNAIFTIFNLLFADLSNDIFLFCFSFSSTSAYTIH